MFAPPCMKKGPDMQMKRVVLSLALSISCGVAVHTAASAEEYRGTWEQQMACTPDVWRLCSDQIPDASRIVACLRQNTPQLSNGCRAVFESNASAPQQATPRVPQQTAPRARAAPPVRPQPAQPKPYDDDE
jgi:hypothetical protein